LSRQKLESLSLKLDLEYNIILGLTKRDKLPINFSIEKAKEIKLILQEQVMHLWGD
jgi:hypothetical protein